MNEFNLFEILEDLLKNSKNQGNNNQKFFKAQVKKSKKIGNLEDKLNFSALILDILNMSLNHSPYFLKCYCISESQKFMKYPFLSLITDQFIECSDIPLQNLVLFFQNI